MAGRFELYQDPAGKWRWRLRGNRNAVLAVGQAHTTKGGAITEIGRVVNGVKDALTIEVDH
jgi:uncharacterized protein YegP (UPF0339 family)